MFTPKFNLTYLTKVILDLTNITWLIIQRLDMHTVHTTKAVNNLSFDTINMINYWKGVLGLRLSEERKWYETKEVKLEESLPI